MTFENVRHSQNRRASEWHLFALSTLNPIHNKRYSLFLISEYNKN